MNWIENILILTGISLDVFAAMECQGALMAKINKKQLTIICSAAAIWQFVSLTLGYFLSVLLYQKELSHDEKTIGQGIAVVIFFGLGIRLVIKAIKNERMIEHREDILKIKNFMRIAGATGIYSFFAGFAFGFLDVNLPFILVIAACITVVFIIMGIYTGYHYGFAHKTKAYIGGSIFLWIAGIDVIVKYIL